MIRPVLGIAIFAAYALFLALTTDAVWRLSGWAPRGASYGITMQYTFWAVCFQGIVTQAILGKWTLAQSLGLNIAFSAAVLYATFPGVNRGMVPHLNLIVGALVMCAAYVLYGAKIRPRKSDGNGS